jgi:hypothetical protein
MNATTTRSDLRGARIGLIVFAATGVLIAAVAWFLHTYVRVEHEIPLPPGGEAVYNPLYALKQSLQADGLRVDARQRLDLSAHMPAARDTLLLFGDARELSQPDALHVLDWVQAGGHLIVRTPPDRDWDKRLPAPLFDALGITLHDGGSDCVPFQVQDEKPHVEFCGARRFDFDEETLEPELIWGDSEKGQVYARFAHGKGYVDVLADMDFLTNGRAELADLFNAKPADGGLRDVPHQALTRQILAPNYGHGVVHLVYDAQMPSLRSLLLTRGWPVWVPLVLALFAWLWLRARRFGPQIPSAAAQRRSLLEHVRASGEMLFRYGRSPLLYTAVRAAFFARLRRRDPLTAALHGEAQAVALAEYFKLPAATLRRALQVPASHDRAAFRDRISLLIQLRNQL